MNLSKGGLLLNLFGGEGDKKRVIHRQVTYVVPYYFILQILLIREINNHISSIFNYWYIFKFFKVSFKFYYQIINYSKQMKSKHSESNLVHINISSYSNSLKYLLIIYNLWNNQLYWTYNVGYTLHSDLKLVLTLISLLTYIRQFKPLKHKTDILISYRQKTDVGLMTVGFLPVSRLNFPVFLRKI